MRQNPSCVSILGNLPVLPDIKMNFFYKTDSHGDVDRTEVEPNKYLTSLLAGKRCIGEMSG